MPSAMEVSAPSAGESSGMSGALVPAQPSTQGDADTQAIPAASEAAPSTPKKVMAELDAGLMEAPPPKGLDDGVLVIGLQGHPDIVPHPNRQSAFLFASVCSRPAPRVSLVGCNPHRNSGA